MDATLERILELMKEKRMTAYSIEALLELPHGTFSNWKRGRSRTYYEHIDEIADRLGVTLEFLIRGTENVQFVLSSQETELVGDFRRLSDEAKDVVLKNVRLLTCG